MMKPSGQQSRAGSIAVPLAAATAGFLLGVAVLAAGSAPWGAALAAGIGLAAAWLLWFARRPAGATPRSSTAGESRDRDEDTRVLRKTSENGDAGEKTRSAAAPAVDEPSATMSADEKRRAIMEGELSAAREIQMRLVPGTFPPIPGCPPFDLYATIEPAKQIGGDFYDFWLIGRERLALVMGDVSGKGVPAALFMAMTRTYLRAFSRTIRDPAALLERLNREVSRHNPGCMFVTIFCAFIDLNTGRMEYTNAGHNPPFRKKPGKPVEVMEPAENPPVGFMPGIDYVKKETRLEPGEVLLIYTDGLTEAMNPEREMLGEKRSMDFFDEAANSTPLCRPLLMQFGSQVLDFVAGADKYDDMTLLVYRHMGGEDEDAGGDDEDDGATLMDIDTAMTSLSDFSSFMMSMNPNSEQSGDFSSRDLFMSFSDLKPEGR